MCTRGDKEDTGVEAGDVEFRDSEQSKRVENPAGFPRMAMRELSAQPSWSARAASTSYYSPGDVNNEL